MRRDLDGAKSDAKKVTETKENFSKIVKANEKLHYEFETIQCESMRDNLLFHGLKEKDEEDCIQLIKRICSNDLGIEDDLNIKVAYRLGKKVDLYNPSNDTERTRPELVKFSDRKKRDNIRKNSNKLKGSNISITDQYPKSVVENRKYLNRLLKQVRNTDVKAVLIRDKLFIGGVAYGGGSIQVAIENHYAKKQKKK